MIKVVLSPGLRFNASITALSLTQSDFKYSIYTSTSSKGWPVDSRKNIHFRPLPFKIINYFTGFDRPRWSRELDAIIFDNIVAHLSEECDIFHGWATFSLRSSKRHKKRGSKFILDRACPHILFQESLLKEEAELTNSSYEPASNSFLDRCLEEYELADKIIVPSNYSARSFIKHGFKKEKIQILKLHANFLPKRKKKWVSNKSKFVLGTIGGNPLRKGLKYLVDAWKNLKLKNATLLIKTSETELKKNKELYEKIINDETIFIVPYVKQIENFYLNCDLFCLPSIDDGFGLVVLEAMSVGIPVITTKNVGASEFIKHNENGFVGEKRDILFLENKIHKLYSNTDLLKSFSDNAFSSYNEFIKSNDSYHNNIINCYKNTIEQK